MEFATSYCNSSPQFVAYKPLVLSAIKNAQDEHIDQAIASVAELVDSYRELKNNDDYINNAID